MCCAIFVTSSHHANSQVFSKKKHCFVQSLLAKMCISSLIFSISLSAKTILQRIVGAQADLMGISVIWWQQYEQMLCIAIKKADVDTVYPIQSSHEEG